jgi:redox-sensing transcriptional repressor
MKYGKISNNVIRRLPRYLRKLDELADNGVERISSGELGSQMGLTASQIRQDFSCFGEFGQQGYGYQVESLRREIASILGMNRGLTTILVGIGNLGHALAVNFNFAASGYRLLAAFDVNPAFIGTEIAGIPVYSVDDLCNFIGSHDIDVAVIAVSRNAARSVAAQVAACGIRAICNFTNVDLGLRDTDVLVEDVHFSDSFLTLSYYLAERARNEERERNASGNES